MTSAEVRRCVDTAVRALERDDTPDVRSCVGAIIDAVRRWGIEVSPALVRGVTADDPQVRRLALRTEEHLQRVDELVSQVWRLAARDASPAHLRAALAELAAAL